MIARRIVLIMIMSLISYLPSLVNTGIVDASSIANQDTVETGSSPAKSDDQKKLLLIWLMKYSEYIRTKSNVDSLEKKALEKRPMLKEISKNISSLEKYPEEEDTVTKEILLEKVKFEKELKELEARSYSCPS